MGTGRTRAVIFDLDGLLIDSEPLSQEAWRQAARLYGGEMTPGLLQRMLGLRQIEGASLVRETLGLHVSAEVLRVRRNDVFMDLIPGRIKLMPGARELLEELRRRAIPCGLATSAERRYVTAVLGELRLDDTFAVRVVADDVTRGKPFPDVYLLAAERLGIPPADCLVLEDAPNGVAAAKAAGMSAVAVPNSDTRSLDLSAADARLPSLLAVRDELDALLDR
jgi:HAD superfamily hydrolase (TIGR01509 family)